MSKTPDALIVKTSEKGPADLVLGFSKYSPEQLKQLTKKCDRCPLYANSLKGKEGPACIGIQADVILKKTPDETSASVTWFNANRTRRSVLEADLPQIYQRGLCLRGKQ